MTVVDQIAVDGVVPDGIEAVEAYRCWTLVDGRLQSLNGGGTGTVWEPGQPLEARCHAAAALSYKWSVVRLGMTHEQATQRTDEHNQRQRDYTSMSMWSAVSPTYMPRPPEMALPDGYGFELLSEKHGAPHENCTCGVYAATTMDGVPAGGNVYGKVKLWGKVVPGEKGYRAESAYPSEFRVTPDLVDDPALKAFGVPIVIDEAIPQQEQGGVIGFATSAVQFQNAMNSMSASIGSTVLSTGDYPRKSRAKWVWWAAVTANVVAFAANVTIAVFR